MTQLFFSGALIKAEVITEHGIRIEKELFIDPCRHRLLHKNKETQLLNAYLYKAFTST